MQENIISWNLANWVSVVLMALVGFTLLGFVMSIVRKNKGSADDSTPNQSPQQSA